MEPIYEMNIHKHKPTSDKCGVYVRREEWNFKLCLLLLRFFSILADILVKKSTLCFVVWVSSFLLSLFFHDSNCWCCDSQTKSKYFVWDSSIVYSCCCSRCSQIGSHCLCGYTTVGAFFSFATLGWFIAILVYTLSIVLKRETIYLIVECSVQIHTYIYRPLSLGVHVIAYRYVMIFSSPLCLSLSVVFAFVCTFQSSHMFYKFQCKSQFDHNSMLKNEYQTYAHKSVQTNCLAWNNFDLTL